jgi:hypothetical protein
VACSHRPFLDAKTLEQLVSESSGGFRLLPITLLTWRRMPPPSGSISSSPGTPTGARFGCQCWGRSTPPRFTARLWRSAV